MLLLKGVTVCWSFSSCGVEELSLTIVLCFLNGGTKAEGVLMLSLITVFLRLSVFLRNGGTNMGILEYADLLSPVIECCDGVF